MRHFVDDDAGYQQWLSNEPDGFVINTYRSPSSAYMVLHRATCKTISGQPARGTTFMGEYSKVCGTREELQRFSGSLGGEARPCRLCLRQVAVPSGGGGRYGPLHVFLASRDDSVTAMAFADIEALVGELPASARLHRPWWANGTNQQARAWRDAGWRVQSVDQAREQVVFERDDRQMMDGRQSALTAKIADIDFRLHPLIEAETRPQFLIGKHEQGVFASMRAVEVRVRQLAGLGNDAIGVDLMNKAFGPNGRLTDLSAPRGEQEGTRMLFAGAYAVLRNPAGHRQVNYEDVSEAAEAVQAASLLMRILDRVEARLRPGGSALTSVEHG